MRWPLRLHDGNADFLFPISKSSALRARVYHSSYPLELPLTATTHVMCAVIWDDRDFFLLNNYDASHRLLMLELCSALRAAIMYFTEPAK
jgi:hypothetical protein